MEIEAPSAWYGHTIKELDVRAKYGVNIIAVRKKSREMNVAPGGDYVIESGDVVAALGGNEALEHLHDL